MIIRPVIHFCILISMNALLLSVLSLNRFTSFTAHQLFWLGNIIAIGVVLVGITMLLVGKYYGNLSRINSLYAKAIIYAFFFVFVINISRISYINLNEFEKILLGIWLIVFSGFSEDFNVNSGARFSGGLLTGIGLIDLAQLLPALFWKIAMYSGAIIIGATFIYYIFLVFIARRQKVTH